MNKIICKHCSHTVTATDVSCTRCGIPLPPNHGHSSQRKFVVFFIAVVLFCIFMMVWLPPSWSSFLNK